MFIFVAMGGGHHHNERLPIPDYRIYHVGDHTPRLQRIERMLAAKGLKDPWMRNEVWRYDEVMNGSPKMKILRTMGFGGRGFIIGNAKEGIWITYYWYLGHKFQKGLVFVI
jgi:NADH dehydrogenase (ubiquinone) 1 beta subcomplex subunit 3